MSVRGNENTGKTNEEGRGGNKSGRKLSPADADVTVCIRMIATRDIDK